MSNINLFSIGHGNKDVSVFIKELQSFNIEYVIDIRSFPSSKWNRQFNKNNIESALRQFSIKYVYMGKQLGGLPADENCYRIDRTVDYSKMKEADFFKAGISRLKTAHEKKIKAALMCSESKPEQCHRSKLIGVQLHECGIAIEHIVGVGSSKSQNQVISLIENKNGQGDFFSDLLVESSRKAY